MPFQQMKLVMQVAKMKQILLFVHRLMMNAFNTPVIIPEGELGSQPSFGHR